ncbi:MAG: hypothetical protein ACC742_00360 [Thermoanaerobaculales bacterium]
MNPPNLSLVLVMACFGATLWLVKRFLIQPVGSALEDRHRRIDDAQREWTAKHEAYLATVARVEEELETAAREAAQIRAQARQQAQDARQRALEEVRGRADTRFAEALHTLESNAVAAREDLRRRAKELARLLAGRLLGREVSS